MGKRLATSPDSLLRRISSDPRISSAARRAVLSELEARMRNNDHCPDGKGCSKWDCEKDH